MRVMQSIGDRIKHVRVSLLDISQEALAKRLHVSRGAVGNWELDKEIGIKNIFKFCEETGTPFLWLLLGQGKTPETHRDLNTSLTHVYAGRDQERVVFVIEKTVEVVLQYLEIPLSDDARKQLTLEIAREVQSILEEPVIREASQDWQTRDQNRTDFVIGRTLRKFLPAPARLRS